MIRILVAAAVLGAVSPALAQVSGRSGRWGSFEIGAGTYRPDLDNEDFPTLPPGSLPPYERTFGTSRSWVFQLGVYRALYTKLGSLEVGFRTGYFQDTGQGFKESTTDPSGYEPSGEETKLRIVPTSVALQYRFDWPVERYGIPLAPYGRVAFERFNWWITDGAGDQVMKGATNGWSAAGGVAFLLDIFDSTLARELDRDSGVNHTYLFFEVGTSSINDFGSSSSWDMSAEETTFAGGLLLVF